MLRFLYKNTIFEVQNVGCKETLFLNPRDNLNLYYDATPLFVTNIFVCDIRIKTIYRLWDRLEARPTD